MGRDDVEPCDLSAIQCQLDRIKARRTVLRPVIGDGIEDVAGRVIVEPGNATKRHSIQHQLRWQHDLIEKHGLIGSLGKGRRSN